MAILTFPVLSGLSFPVKKTAIFNSIIHESVDGVTTGQSLQPFPKYAFDLPFEFLRSDNVNVELQSLLGFYESCRGRALPFHFSDPDDNAVVGQLLGVGDGVTTAFALLRAMGTSIDPVQDAIAAGMAVRVNGVTAPFTTLATAQYATIYGVNVTTPPPVGQLVVADFSFNWLCRFDMDTQDFSKFGYLYGKGLFESKSVKFTSLLQ